MIKECSDAHYINEVGDADEHYMVRKCDLIIRLKFVKLKPIFGQDMSMHSDDIFFEFADVFKTITQRAFEKNKISKFEVTN